VVNRYSLIAKTTLIAVTTSVAITSLIETFFTEDGVSSIGFMIAIIAPLLISPAVSFMYVRPVREDRTARRAAAVFG